MKKDLILKIAFLLSITVVAISFSSDPISKYSIYTGIGAIISTGVFFSLILKNKGK